MLNIKIEKFEGPLGILLQLIEREEFDITEVSLAKIADQYIDYIKNPSHVNPEEIADFLVVAAKLLLIKSKALLPYIYPEEENEIEELEQQLKMYKEFLEIAKQIEAVISKKKFMFAREFNRQTLLATANLAAGIKAGPGLKHGVGIFSPPKKLKAMLLNKAFNELLNQIRPAAKSLEEKKIEHKVNIEDKILSIQQMLINRIKVSFNKILNNTKSKVEIIVSFLAILELIKQRDIMVSQEGLFNEILISKHS